jgi:hypothetical protein
VTSPLPVKGCEKGLCSALSAVEQGGIFILLHLLSHGTSVFPVSSEGSPDSVASYDTQRDVENLQMQEVDFVDIVSEKVNDKTELHTE